MKKIKKAKIQYEIEGKVDTLNFSVREPKNTILTEAQLALIDTLIDEQRRALKSHMSKHSWDVWTFAYEEDILSEIFGCNWSDYVRARLVDRQDDVAVLYGSDGQKFVNTAQKVFYDANKNRLYVAKTPKLGDHICLGKFDA